MTEQRIVSFDLMPHDPDYHFVLTEALREFAARQRAEAEDPQCGDAEAHTRWAETAEGALGRIEEALSAPAAPVRYEWHEECGGPICQRCDRCPCEGGCACPAGPTHAPAGPSGERSRVHGWAVRLGSEKA